MATAPVKQLVFITSNANKLREVQQILGGALPDGWGVTNMNVDLDEVQSADPVVVATKKARAAVSVLREKAARGEAELPRFAMVEDTCLCFRALGGLPGPFVRYFMEKVGPSGLHRLLAGFEDKHATAVCTLVLLDVAHDEAVLLQGTCEGTVVEPRGANNFGWDPVFQPADEHQRDKAHPQTYAEMPAEQKNSFSHRARAMAALRAWVEAHKDRFL